MEALREPVEYTGWRTSITGNNNLAWPILPAIAAIAAVAANQHYKLVELDDRWTAFAGVAAGMNLNLIFGIRPRCSVVEKAADSAAQIQTLLEALSASGRHPYFIDMSSGVIGSGAPIHYFTESYRVKKDDLFEGELADGIKAILDNKWEKGGLDLPVEILYQKYDTPAGKGVALKVLHQLINIDKTAVHFDLVEARKGVLGEKAMECVKQFESLTSVRCAAADVEELLEVGIDPKQLQICVRDELISSQAGQAIEAAGFIETFGPEHDRVFVKEKRIADLDDTKDIIGLDEVEELNLEEGFDLQVDENQEK